MDERAATNAVEREGAWHFGPFELDLANRTLSRTDEGPGQPIALGSRYFDALVLLTANAGDLVTKDRFMEEVWRGIPVTDEALTQCIRTLRRALGDEAGAPRFVATVPKHGYRFLAEVLRGDGEGEPRGKRAAVSAGPAGGRVAGATTIGGGLAGALGGLFYGLAGTSGGGMPVLVMVALVAALGVLAGAGVGAGMGVATMVRAGSATFLVAGATLGGTLIGAFGQTLGRDGIAALTGARVSEITGLFEGLVLGIAVGMAAALARAGGRGLRAVVALAGLTGAAGGAIIALLGGSLLGTSLLALESRFPGSDLAIDRVGRLFGDPGFGAFSRFVTSTLEGATFAACIAAAVLYAEHRHE